MEKDITDKKIKEEQIYNKYLNYFNNIFRESSNSKSFISFDKYEFKIFILKLKQKNFNLDILNLTSK
jgi:hypothetical protein